MRIISRAPVRISLFGGGTDYPGYYRRHPGAVLGGTIDKFTHVSLNVPENCFPHRVRLSYSKIELAENIETIEHPSVRECLKFLQFSAPLDIHLFSDLPAKTGLGSSSSCTVGLLHALHALLKTPISQRTLAEEALFIEQHCICENVGSQDQFHAAFGGVNIIEFHHDKIDVRPVKLDHSLLETHLLLLYTGLTRYASDVLHEQVEKTNSRVNDLYLQRMYEMVFEAEQLLARPDSLLELGKLLNESWELKKRLSEKITTSKIDEAYSAAKRAGAYGGKLCGAGSGGFLLLLIEPTKQMQIREALPDLPVIPVRFEHKGSTIVYAK
jgi:D-glycero-alpha-D-manno-heptose-7-phosphate kinase